MLDSAPLGPTTPPNAHFSPTAANDVQMHVGIRTTAFGAVEIHTTVVQNQVGIAIQEERGLAHWFSSEVPNLESGLKDHRLNLTAVDFGNDRSGVQTATSFQQGQPRQSFSQTTGFPAAFGDQDAASEASTTELLPVSPDRQAAGNSRQYSCIGGKFMYIPLLQSLTSPAAASSSSTPTPKTSASTAVDDVNNMFLQLLTAQLKSQSPISPLDPNQFVAQLAQFNSLSELTQIRDLMQTLVTIASPQSSSTTSSIPSANSH